MSTQYLFLCFRIVTKPSGDIGMFDPTEIHNRQQLKNYMRESLIRLGIHLIFFFIYLYWYVLVYDVCRCLCCSPSAIQMLSQSVYTCYTCMMLLVPYVVTSHHASAAKSHVIGNFSHFSSRI